MYVVLLLVAVLSTLAPLHARTMLASLSIITPSQPLPEPQQQTQRAAPRLARKIVIPSAVRTQPASLLASVAPSATLPLPSLASLVLNHAPNAP